MRVLVTGGAGYIGGYVVPRLVRRGHQVTVLTRDGQSSPRIDGLELRLAQGDICDPASLLPAVEGIDRLIHLANIYTMWEPDPTIYERVNVEGTRNVMEAALDAGVEKVVHVSTLAVWGRPDQVPYTESTPVGPERFSAYAESKYQGDLIAWRLHEERGLPLVVVYPGPSIGVDDPKGTGRYVRDVARGRIPAELCGDSLLTLTHVEDVADAIVLAAEKEGNVGERYLIGSECFTVCELNAFIAQLARRSPPRLPLPDPITRLLAWMATRVADMTGRPPPLGMAEDQIETMRHGFCYDGSKAERELGLRYRPVRDAIADIVRQL